MLNTRPFDSSSSCTIIYTSIYTFQTSSFCFTKRKSIHSSLAKKENKALLQCNPQPNILSLLSLPMVLSTVPSALLRLLRFMNMPHSMCHSLNPTHNSSFTVMQCYFMQLNPNNYLNTDMQQLFRFVGFLPELCNLISVIEP